MAASSLVTSFAAWLLAALAVCVLPAPAAAGPEPGPSEIVVTSSGDNGPGSLRQALAEIGAGGTITIDPSLKGQTVLLTNGELIIGKSLSLVGPGAGSFTLSGRNEQRVLQVQGNTVVRISGVTIRDGRTPDGTGGFVGYDGGDGAGILNLGTLTLDACDLTANQTGSGGGSSLGPGGRGGHGGAVFNAGELTLTHCRVFENSTGPGGYSNMAWAGSSGAGGGIFNDTSGVLRIAHCLISTNSTADGVGGGPVNAGDGGAGGGIFSASTNGVVILTASSLVGNSAGQGGRSDWGPDGINRDGGAGGSGGAIVAFGPVRLEECAVVDNRAGSGGPGGDPYGGSGAGGSGGAIWANADLTLINTTLRGNWAGDGVNEANGGQGGAVFAMGPLQVKGCAFVQNRAGQGGYGRSAYYVILVFGSETRQADPGGDGGGGGAIWSFADCEVANSTFSGNRAGNGGHGGAGRPDHPRFETFPGGAGGRGGSGGAILATGGAQLRNCTVADNTAGAGGAAGELHPTGQAGSAGSGGGLAVGGTNEVSVANTLLAANHGLGNGPDVSGTVNSLGHNLVGITDGSAGFGAAGDLTGTASSPLAPGVGPLAENGGSTLTHALLPGSPAIDAGSSALVTDLTLDQRGLGFSRLAGPAVDIGAYELQAASVAFTGIEPTPAGIRLRLQGPGNAALQIEWNSQPRSTDWQPLFAGTTDGVGFLEYTDTTKVDQGQRFYRVVPLAR